MHGRVGVCTLPVNTRERGCATMPTSRSSSVQTTQMRTVTVPLRTNIWPPQRHTESARGVATHRLDHTPRASERRERASPSEARECYPPPWRNTPCPNAPATPPTYATEPASSPAHPSATGAATPQPPKQTTSSNTTEAEPTTLATLSPHANVATASEARPTEPDETQASKHAANKP